MGQHYSDPRRESDPHALPNVETFEARIMRCTECEAEYPETDEGGTDYRNTNEETTCCHGERLTVSGSGWFYWFCFPGCVPDSDPSGPFETEDEALRDAREGLNDDDETDEVQS